MSNEFTRGPWYRSGCTVYAPNDRNNANRFTAYVQDAHSSREDLLSVARMMQAAPDLFDALQAITDLYDTDEGCRSTPEYIAARAAIAKATGGDV